MSRAQRGELGAGQPPCRGFGARSPKNIGARDVGRETNAGTAPVNLGDRFGAASTVDLRITNDASSQVTWSLAGVSGTPTGLKFNVYDESSGEIKTGLALGVRIGGEGTFADYGFTIADNTLKFVQLA